MRIPLQQSLFDDTGGRPDRHRTVLAGGAWVEHRPAWTAEPEDLFERLLRTVPWRAERRVMYDRMVDVPRMLAFYDTDDPLPDAVLDGARAELVSWFGGEPGGPVSSVGLCLYRDGRDSVAWHGDTIGRGATEDTVVAVVSLGQPRRFLLRPRGGGILHQFELGGGDLLVMGGSCQRTWEHAVPKTRRAVGPRISVQFRPRGVR